MNSQHAPREATPTPARTERTSSRAVIIVTSVIGGVLLLGVIVTGLFGLLSANAVSDQTVTQEIAGVTELDVSVSSGDFTLEFDEIDVAELDVKNGRGEWELRRSGDTLVVHSPWQPWFNFCFGWCDNEQVTLTLPTELQDTGELDATLSLSAGRLHASGEFELLRAELNAGEMTLNGTAETFESEVNAGKLNGGLDDVAVGTLHVNAGSTELRLDGKAPDRLDLSVNAGGIDLTLPDGEYRVNVDVSAGSVDNNLRTSSDSSHEINAEVSAGNIILRH